MVARVVTCLFSVILGTISILLFIIATNAFHGAVAMLTSIVSLACICINAVSDN